MVNNRQLDNPDQTLTSWVTHHSGEPRKVFVPPPTNNDSRSPPTSSNVDRSPFTMNTARKNESNLENRSSIFHKIHAVNGDNSTSRDSIGPPPASQASKSGFIAIVASNATDQEHERPLREQPTIDNVLYLPRNGQS